MRALAVALAASVLLAGCGSSGAKKAAAPSSTGPAAGVAATLTKGLAGLHSAYLTVDSGDLGGTSSGTFTFAGGKEQASDLTIVQGGKKIRVITVGATSYAKLPAGENTSSTPWRKVSDSSKNEFVKALSAPLTVNQSVGSLGALVDITKSAKSVHDKGASTVDGVRATQYALVIDPAAAKGKSDLQQELQLLGSTQVPVDLWLDAQGRPVRLLIDVSLAGQKFSIDVHASRFNAPATIAAPPASQRSSTRSAAPA